MEPCPAPRPGDGPYAEPGDATGQVEGIIDRIWGRAPETHSGAVESLETWRTETGEQRRAELETPPGPPDAQSGERSSRLLEELGL